MPPAEDALVVMARHLSLGEQDAVAGAPGDPPGPPEKPRAPGHRGPGQTVSAYALGNSFPRFAPRAAIASTGGAIERVCNRIPERTGPHASRAPVSPPGGFLPPGERRPISRRPIHPIRPMQHARTRRSDLPIHSLRSARPKPGLRQNRQSWPRTRRGDHLMARLWLRFGFGSDQDVHCLGPCRAVRVGHLHGDRVGPSLTVAMSERERLVGLEGKFDNLGPVSVADGGCPSIRSGITERTRDGEGPDRYPRWSGTQIDLRRDVVDDQRERGRAGQRRLPVVGRQDRDRRGGRSVAGLP